MKWLSSYRMVAVFAGYVIAALLTHPVIGSDPEGVRPIAHAGLSRYAGQEPIVLNGTGSYDPDNSDTLSYTWRQISGPTVVIIDTNTATPTISGFVQTDEIQECEFELVISDGQLTSLSDTVKVIIVPDFGENQMRHVNPPFNPSKPTFVFFGGGDCIVGFPGISCTWDGPDWNSRANVIDFTSGYGPDPHDAPGNVDAPRTYYRLADMIIVYLSRVAPDYQQPIQTAGWSTGGQPAIDAGIHLNLTYADARYAVNRVTFIDATPHCRRSDRSEYSESIATFLSSSVDGEQCCIDDYTGADGTAGSFPSWLSIYPSVLRVGSSLSHVDIVYWYANSLMSSDMNQFNHGVVGGAYWSVLGPGKNLQLASTPGNEAYRFEWFGSRNDGYMELVDECTYPGRLPEPVTLIESFDIEDPNGFVLTCEESENAVGYELLFGADPYRVMDYDIISDTPAPPNDVITAIPSYKTWWTIRVRDQYGSTIYADPISMVTYNPNPINGSVHPDTWANLSWNEGVIATSYDVYFGENFGDVQDGTVEVFRGNQTTTYFIVGFDGFPYPDGLVPGTTYFWRIDDVGADSTVIHKGKIWMFTVSL
jgi:hypothetical protein